MYYGGHPPYLLERNETMKIKEYHFDVELIIDHSILFMNTNQNVSTHHVLRGLSLKELNDLIHKNDIPESENIKITFNIRGVNY